MKKKEDDKKSKKDKEKKPDAFTELRKKLGIIKASEVRSGHLVRMPTGIPSLDRALNGGVPCGKIIQLAGPNAGGKTTLAYQIAGNVQARKGKRARILWIPAEGPIDKEYARRLGFIVPWSKEEMRVLEVDRGCPLTDEERAELSREICPVDTLPMNTAEEVLQDVLDAAASDEYDLIVIDSISTLIAGEDLERKVKGKTIDVPVGGERAYARNINGILGSFTNRFFLTVDRESPKGRPNLTVILVIHQVRADVSGGVFDWKVPGSFALKHAKAVDIWVYRGKQEKEEEEVVGRFTHWLIAKAKYGVKDGAKGLVLLRPRSGFHLASDLFGVLRDAGLASFSGGTWSLVNPDGELIAEYNKTGQDAVVERIRSDPGTWDRWYKVFQSLYERKPILEWGDVACG